MQEVSQPKWNFSSQAVLITLCVLALILGIMVVYSITNFQKISQKLDRIHLSLDQHAVQAMVDQAVDKKNINIKPIKEQESTIPDMLKDFVLVEEKKKDLIENSPIPEVKKKTMISPLVVEQIEETEKTPQDLNVQDLIDIPLKNSLSIVRSVSI